MSFVRVVKCVNVAFAVLVALLFFMWSIDEPDGFVTALTNFLDGTSGKVAGGFLGAAILVLTLLGAWKEVRGYRFAEAVALPGQHGEIRVSVDALEESLTRTARALDELHDMRVRVYVEKDPRRPIKVIGSGVFYDAPDMRQVCDGVQRELKHRFDEILKVEREVLYDISVRRFRPPGETEKQEEEVHEEPFFRGPEYPIE